MLQVLLTDFVGELGGNDPTVMGEICALREDEEPHWGAFRFIG